MTSQELAPKTAKTQGSIPGNEIPVRPKWRQNTNKVQKLVFFIEKLCRSLWVLLFTKAEVLIYFPMEKFVLETTSSRLQSGVYCLHRASETPVSILCATFLLRVYNLCYILTCLAVQCILLFRVSSPFCAIVSCDTKTVLGDAERTILSCGIDDVLDYLLLWFVLQKTTKQ